MFGISMWNEKPFAPKSVEKYDKVEPTLPSDKDRKEGEGDGSKQENFEPHKGQNVDVVA